MTEQSPPLPTIEIPNGVSVLGILETIGGLISFMLFVIVLATHSILFLTILAVYAAKDFGVATSILKRASWGWYLILIGAVYDIVPTVYLYSMYLFSIHTTSLWPIIESFPPTLLILIVPAVGVLTIAYVTRPHVKAWYFGVRNF